MVGIEKKMMFYFENMWTRHSNFVDIVIKGQEMQPKSEIEDLVKGIENCGKVLSKWNRDVFGNLNSSIGQKQKELEELTFNSNLEAQKIKSF